MYPVPGVIAFLKSNKAADWIDSITSDDANVLDLYLKLKYGPRILNSLGSYNDFDVETISNMIWYSKHIKWDRLYTSYSAKYNPIWNVDGTETTTETRDLNYGDSGTDEFVDSGSDNVRSQIISDHNETNQNVNGFNSSSSVPAGNESSDRTGEQLDTTNYGKSNKETRNLNRTDKGTITTEHIRGGNIGVTMTQQMLQADIDYWNRPDALFFDTVMRDIVDIITYKIYRSNDNE